MLIIVLGGLGGFGGLGKLGGFWREKRGLFLSFYCCEYGTVIGYVFLGLGILWGNEGFLELISFFYGWLVFFIEYVYIRD